jgi:hypothetical protein
VDDRGGDCTPFGTGWPLDFGLVGRAAEEVDAEERREERGGEVGDREEDGTPVDVEAEASDGSAGGAGSDGTRYMMAVLAEGERGKGNQARADERDDGKVGLAASTC